MKLVPLLFLSAMLFSACVPTAATLPVSFTTPGSDGELPEPTLTGKSTPSLILTPAVPPTPMGIFPALNGTPIAVIPGVLNSTSFEKLKVLKQTSSIASINLLGADADRFFVQNEGSGEIHDTKTGALLWRPPVPKNWMMNREGTQIVSFNDDFTKMTIMDESGKVESFTIGSAQGSNLSLNFSYNFQKRLLSVVPKATPNSNPIMNAEVYSIDSKQLLYSLPGNNFGFTWTGKYMNYTLGKLIEFANAETGEKVSEFGTGGKDPMRLSWDDEYIAFSRNGEIEIYSVAERNLIRAIQVQKGIVLPAENFNFSKGNKALMILHPDGNIRTWDIGSGETLKTEKTDLKSLNQLRVSDDGEIIKFNLPEFPSRSWNVEFSFQTEMEFSQGSKSLEFSNQLSDGYFNISENCTWNLAAAPNCTQTNLEIAPHPTEYMLERLGMDGNKYALKTAVRPVTLHRGWSADGEKITQLPPLSIKGKIENFLYNPDAGVLIVLYDDGEVYLLNHKENTRRLLDPRFVNAATKEKLHLFNFFNRYFFSKDGALLYEIVNERNNPSKLDFVTYDSKTLKDVSRVPLEVSLHPEEIGKEKPAIVPLPSASVLSADGKTFYSLVNYVVLSGQSKTYQSAFLTIPVDEPATARIVQTGRDAMDVSNMVMTSKGDLFVVGELATGEVLFIDGVSGKQIGNYHVGGSPVRLAISPDDTLLAVGDKVSGIKIMGVPGK